MSVVYDKLRERKINLIDCHLLAATKFSLIEIKCALKYHINYKEIVL